MNSTHLSEKKKKRKIHNIEENHISKFCSLRQTVLLMECVCVCVCVCARVCVSVGYSGWENLVIKLWIQERLLNP